MAIVERLPEGLTTLLLAYEYVALFLVFLVSEVAIPLPFPSFVVILYVAYIRSQGDGQGNPVLIVLASAAGMVLGSFLLYLLARRVGSSFLDKYGKRIGLTPKRFAGVESWFARHGAMSVAVGYLTPGIRLQTVVAAGIFRIRRSVFLGSTTISALAWTTFYLCAGLVSGNFYRLISVYLEGPYLLAGLGLVLLAGSVVIMVRRKRLSAARAITL